MDPHFPADDVGVRFMRAWVLRNADERRCTLSALLETDCLYTDPHYEDPIIGRGAYLTFVDHVHGEFPEIRFTLLGRSSHHSTGLLDWRLNLRADAAPSFGSFFYELTSQGCISRLVGFGRAAIAQDPQK